MEQVYTSIDLTKVLDEEYDNRKTRIDHLHLSQLRKECQERGIHMPSGSKKEKFVSKLQNLLGEHTLVSENIFFFFIYCTSLFFV